MVAGRPSDDGANLLRALDETGVRVDAAFWYYFPEAEAWRFVLSLPDLSKQGPRAAYAAVQEVIRDRGLKMPLSRVSVVEPDAPLLRLLRTLIRTPPDAVADIVLSRTVVNGQPIEEAIIHRLSRPNSPDLAAPKGQ